MGPVFIAGCGRSGTSYLRTIVDAHPDVFIPSESLFIPDYLRFGRFVPERLLRWLFFHEPQLKCWYEGGSFEGEGIERTIAIVHEKAASKWGATVWGQKTPRFIRHMSLLNRTFPGIRWLLIHRDPRGVAASMKRSEQHTYSVARACRRWLNDNRMIVDFRRSGTSPSNVLLVGFEELVLNYDEMLVKIFSFLSLEPIGRDGVNRLGQPVFFKRSRFRINTVRGDLTPDPGIIEKWREVLTPSEIAYVEQTCAEEMKILGYEPVSDGDTTPGSLCVKGSLKDIAIPFRYVLNWPEYLYFTVLRTLIMRFFALWHSTGRSKDDQRSS